MEKISTLKVLLKYIFGGIGSVTDYLLDILNKALSEIDPSNRKKIQAVLNVSQKILSILGSFKFLCPVKWQTSYSATIEAVTVVAESLSDLEITHDELVKIRSDFDKAVDAWKSPDDDTCVDCDNCED